MPSQPTQLGQPLFIFHKPAYTSPLWTSPPGHFHWTPIVFPFYKILFSNNLFFLNKKFKSAIYTHDKTSKRIDEYTVKREAPSALPPATPFPSPEAPLSLPPPWPLPAAVSTRPVFASLEDCEHLGSALIHCCVSCAWHRAGPSAEEPLIFEGG